MRALESLLADVLGLTVAELDDDTGRDTLAAWSSLRHIQIVNAVEETYEVALTTHEIKHAVTLRQLREVLRGKGVAL